MKRLLPQSLQAQMILLLGLLVLVQIGISGIIVGSLVSDILDKQIGKRALDISETVARNPLVMRRVSEGDPQSEVQKLAETIRQATDAEYVVVCNVDGVRLSHPDPWKIGKPFVGGDETRALQNGESYTSEAIGTLGPSLRGFAPIHSADNQVVGFVAVGYLLEDVDRIVIKHQLQPRVFVFMMALVSLLGAVLISGHFKSAILGLEPREIANLYQERGAIIESIREGVLAVDHKGHLRMANQAARQDLSLPGDETLQLLTVEEVLPCVPFEEALTTGKPVLDREVLRDGVSLIFNLIPVHHQQRVMGVVASFRRKDELDLVTRELSQVREYSELLRAQAHEHSNQLHTVAGLIQIGATEEALHLILDEATDYQELISLLNEAVPHPLLCGLILGKCNRASELKVELKVDPESSLRDIPEDLPQERIVTVLGNLMDNALEAAVAGPGRPKTVQLNMTDLGHDLIIEVEDSGAGVAPHEVEHIFKRGVTSKNGDGHGVGLHLVHENLNVLGGYITVGSSELGGALFTAIIPKKDHPS